MHMRSLGTLDVNQTPVLELEGETEEEQATGRRRYGADVVLADESRWDCHGA